jgi:regulator of replication initiation timing
LLGRLTRLAEYAGRRYKTVTEVKKVLDTSLDEKSRAEAEFKELALKLKDAIELGTVEGQFNDEDIVTLLERLSRLAEYVGGKYKTVTEVKKVLDTSLMGYGQELALKYKLEDVRNALNEGLSVEQAARITGIPIDELKKHLVSNEQ